MLFRAEIVARHEEGVLERILRVCRHRNFSLQSFRAVVDAGEQLLHVQLEGESERPLLMLNRQLEKLIEVVDVSVAALKRDSQARVVDARVQIGQVRRTVYANSSHG